MKNPITITVEPADPEMLRQMALYRRNAIWASDHWMLFGEHRGQYVAVAQGEMFVASSHQEAKQLAQAKYPDDVPFLSYIPLEKYERIYAS
jgi:hypothetical protein